METPCDELQFTVELSVNGSAELLEDAHTVRFTPDANFNRNDGTASFAYSVTDTGDGCLPDSEDCGTDVFSDPITAGPAVVTIDVTPVNDVPQAIGGDARVSEDGSIEFPLPVVDPDVEDVLTFVVVANLEHGCLNYDAETGLVRYALHDGYIGPDSFTFLVNDGTADSNMAQVSMTVAALQSGFEFHGGILTVKGTSGNDSIRLVRVGRGYDIVTNFGTYKIADRTALKGIVVRARAGNDVVNLSPLDPDKTADVFGRAGNDNIRGGAAADILRGGLGNDTLTGGTGDDLLIGGDGSDRLVGSAGSDLLLAGIVDDLCRELDLRGLLDVWRAAKTRNDKAAAAELWRDYVSDDGIFDLLTGAVGADAFFASPLDRIVDRKAEDIVVPV